MRALVEYVFESSLQSREKVSLIYFIQTRPTTLLLVSHNSPSYYIGLNFGVLSIDWEKETLEIVVRSQDGETVLSTGQRTLRAPHASWTEEELRSIHKTMDGHLLPWLKTASIAVLVTIAIYFVTSQRLS